MTGVQTCALPISYEKSSYVQAQPQIHVQPQVQPQAQLQLQVQPQVVVSQPVATVETPTVSTSNANLITVKSPMIGTFYRSSKPDSPLFVNVGDEVKIGQTVCIIEAMKLFNEVESEVAGRIVKILVDNASPVEYDQPLFLVEPI